MKISNRSVNKCGRESLLFRLWLPHLFFILEEYQIWRGFEGFRETEEKKNRIVKYAEEKLSLIHILRAGSMPTTSQVNPTAAEEIFESVLKEGKDVLYLAFSSGLSGTYNSCRVAAEELRDSYPDRKLEVIDTLAASMGEGLLVWYAVKMKEEGKSMEEVCLLYTSRSVLLLTDCVFAGRWMAAR